MAQYIDKDALVAEIMSRIDSIEVSQKAGLIKKRDADTKIILFKSILSLIDTLEVKGLAPMAYVVTRCEEHSDYVEEVFFDEDKAQKYCDQFKGNENEYARHITKIEVTL